MSVKSQQTLMKRLSQLLEQDLSYVDGENENGFNGAKAEFHSKGKSFLRGMAKDLHFNEFKVQSNPAGAASSGDITLYGIWPEGKGLMIRLSDGNHAVHYRTIKHMHDYTGGLNRFFHRDHLAYWSYEKLLYTLERDRLAGVHEPAA